MSPRPRAQDAVRGMIWNPLEVNMRATLPCLLLFVTACARPAAPFTARVVGVSDGDTITVLQAEHDQVRIRLEGVDAPELHQAFGRRAKEFTSSLVFGRVVEVRPKERDRYGRLVATIIVDGRNLCYELVAAGLAWHYTRYSSDARLAAAEAAARTHRIGLWADPAPIPPWEFRRAHPRQP